MNLKERLLNPLYSSSEEVGCNFTPTILSTMLGVGVGYCIGRLFGVDDFGCAAGSVLGGQLGLLFGGSDFIRAIRPVEKNVISVMEQSIPIPEESSRVFVYRAPRIVTAEESSAFSYVRQRIEFAQDNPSP